MLYEQDETVLQITQYLSKSKSLFFKGLFCFNPKVN